MLDGAPIAPVGTPLSGLPQVVDLAGQLGKRLLLRYLEAKQVGSLAGGTTERQYVTPTAYSPEETITWLALPPSQGPRTWVLLLEPTRLTDVFGPRWIQAGGGIEYVLDSGFKAEAVADVAPGLPGSSRWELEVR